MRLIDRMILKFIDAYMNKHQNCIKYTIGHRKRVIRVFTEDWYDKNVKGGAE